MGGTGAGGRTAPGAAGAGGTSLAEPCRGAADPRLLVADQRVLLLTRPQIVNTVRMLIDPAEADALAKTTEFDLTTDVDRSFPPADSEEASINGGNIVIRDLLAQHIAQHVLDHFAAVTKCTTPTDACASDYLLKKAPQIFRRALTPPEQQRLMTLYAHMRNHVINGYAVSSTVEEATQHVVYALFMSPQLTWRFELGNPSMTSTAPPGVYLSDAELATELSFFLTDRPPDDMLLAAANGNALRANLAQHVTRILGNQQAKDWLTAVMEAFYLINKLPEVGVDVNKWPELTAAAKADMSTEARMFLDRALWSAPLDDLVLSRTTFVNSTLAPFYGITPPPGASATTFVQTTLPKDQRAGILTNLAFITSAARSDEGAIVPRGLRVKAAMLCLTTPSPSEELLNSGVIDLAKAEIDKQTAQEQVASRETGLCGSCHASFDAYGLVLEYYDNIGRYRTKDKFGNSVDARTTLPAELGGSEVSSAVELAEKVAASPTFANCMAASMLQLAMTVYNASTVELPLLDKQRGCAVTDVVQRYQQSGLKTFPQLVTAVVQSPAFVLRKAAP